MNTYRVIEATANLQSDPDQHAECVSQAIYGEYLDEIAHEGEWLYVKHQKDDYRGFVHQTTMAEISSSPTEPMTTRVKVHTRNTLLFERPNIKSRVVKRIPFAAQLSVENNEDTDFYKTCDNLYVWRDHCQRLSEPHPLAPLQLAKSHFLGVPYYWGGRSTDGLDCSGLIQLLAQSQQLSLPRDSQDQEHFLTQSIEFCDRQVGDLVFWPGHTGILTNSSLLLHATAFSMCCCEEPLDQVIQRAGEPSSIKRLF